MEKRTITAIILSVAVLLIYQAVITKTHKQNIQPVTAVVSQVGQDMQPSVYQGVETSEQMGVPSIEAQEYTIEKDTTQLAFSSQGAVITNILFKEAAEEYSLIEQKDAGFAPLELWFGNIADNSNYTVLSMDGEINFSAEIEEKLEIEKRITFSNSKYGAELEIVFRNLSGIDRKMAYSIVAASNINRSAGMDKRFSGIQSRINGATVWENLRKLKLNNGWDEVNGFAEWTGLRNAYYEVILKPEKPASGVILRRIDKDVFACGLKIDTFVIPAGQQVSHKYLLYAGPGSMEDLAVYGLEDAIYFGKLDFICKFLLKSLNFFYHVTHNYGMAIIVLTLSIGLILFPLSLKNFRAMRQMQVIQPQITKLKEMHQNNPHKLQQEMMLLYKKNKVNPIGGCLPMLLQMPIFFSLYLTLVRSVELKGASFLWIKDLSSTDAVYSFSGNLPVIGEHINLLPILMIIAMFFQQKISSYKKATSDPQLEQQQKMMLIMPLVFGIIFYNLPSGLVLYWLTNTIFMTLVQFYIAKTMPSVETIAG